MLSEALLQKVSAVNKLVESLQHHWPASIELKIKAETAIYDCYPYLFLAAFPPIPEEDVLRLSAAGRLFASSFFMYDPIMDRTQTNNFDAIHALRIIAMQSEAFQLLNSLFPATSLFWQHFQQYLSEYANACLQEQLFTTKQKSFTEYTEDVARQIVIAKNGVARASVAGLAALSGQTHGWAPLVDSINYFNLAYQMLDDLKDWREDWKVGLPSLLLVRALSDAGESVSEAVLARTIYYQGHAQYVLELALQFLEVANKQIDIYPKLPWHDILAGLKRRCHALLTDLERIVAENLQRVQQQPHVQLTFPPTDNIFLQLAWSGTSFLLQQWHSGWGEAKHMMYFSKEQGFTASRECLTGDVFQRALLGDVLCDVNEVLNDNNLNQVLKYEAQYLLARRDKTKLGGWRYFPDLPELPPDADDLAQVMQLFLRLGKEEWVQNFCEYPLSILLTDNSHPDGSFETWIIPKGGRSEEQERQALYAKIAWGIGADNDVVANLLYALQIYDAHRFASVIDKGAQYLLGQQTPEGFWQSSWYHGPYYGTYVCLRFLENTPYAQTAATKAKQFLCASQLPDGGWGLQQNSDCLNTALALLALNYSLLGASPSATVKGSVEQGIEYLAQQQKPDGSWPTASLIRMELGRASGHVQQVLSYGSRTITTGFVIKSLLRWHLQIPYIAEQIREKGVLVK